MESNFLRKTLERIAHELRTYNPAADEYKGEHIHKVWAREIEAALAAPAQSEAKPVATIEGADEYGPRLNWHSHWVNHIGAPLYTAPPSAEDARDAILEETCAAIKADADKRWEDDYMLDANDCIAIVRALQSKKEV